MARDLLINSSLLSVAANICELNLARSFKYGGRKHSPSNHELFMLMVRLRHCFCLIFLYHVFQQDIYQKLKIESKDFYTALEYLTEAYSRPCPTYGTKYSKMDQVKFLKDSL